MESCENMWREMRNQGLDVFKIGISIPAVSRIKMMQYASRNKVLWPIIDKRDMDMYYLLKSQLTGGPSIIFNRYVKVGKTLIEDGSKHVTGTCVGWDATALYTACLASPQMSCMYVRREQPDYRPRYKIQYFAMFTWMQYMSEVEGWSVRNKCSEGVDYRFGRYLADGIGMDPEGNMYIMEFLGCFMHGCQLCHKDKPAVSPDAHRKWLEKKAFYDTVPAFRTKFVWECEWRAICRANPEWRMRMENMKPEFLRKHPGPVTERQILEAVGTEEFFGFLVVTIRTPDNPEVRAKMRKFPILFCNHDMTESDVTSDVMKKHMEDRKIKFGTHRRLLLSGFHASEMLVSSALLKFYINFGLVVEKVHQTISYCQSRCFNEFVADITRHRQEAQNDPSRAVISSIYKMFGNSAYGSMCK